MVKDEFKMKSSLIISTMNRPFSLTRLLTNVANQDVLPDEVIIIEAGGYQWSDTTLPNDSYIEYILIDAIGASLSEARELGRVKAKNEILIFLDDDIIIPRNYISEVYKAFSANRSIIGVGGIYRDYNSADRKAWKTAIGRILGIYSDGQRNKILKSGWADYVRDPFTKNVTSAEWLFGCNCAIKAQAFDDKNVRIETSLARWSFLEDVIHGHRLVVAYGDCLRILPSLEVVHDPIVTSGAITPETVRMRIVYRYIFWRYELHKDGTRPKFAYFLGMLANTILMATQAPSVDVLTQCIRSYMYILLKKPQSYQACNEFIFQR